MKKIGVPDVDLNWNWFLSYASGITFINGR